MKKLNYWSEKNKVNVSCKLPSCSAKDYFVPSVTKILTKINPDNEDFIPKYNDSYSADLIANLPNNLVLASNSSGTIDCGFSIEKPIGYKIKIVTNISLAQKGLYLQNKIVESGRLELIAFNNGKDSITIEHKQTVGQIYIEPIYLFDWEVS